MAESNSNIENPIKGKISRRSFLKLAGTTAGSLVAAGILEVTGEKVANRWLAYELITGARSFLFKKEKGKNDQADEVIVSMPELNKTIPDLFIAQSSAKCGIEDKCNMGIMWSGKEKAYRNRKIFLDYAAQQVNLPQPPEADKLVYMISSGKNDPLVITADQLSENGINAFDTECLILQAPGKFIGFQPIDCSGITLIHPKSKTIAVIHGNKYLDKTQMVQKAIKTLVSLGIQPEELSVWIGPGAKKMELETNIPNTLKAGETVITSDILSTYVNLLTSSDIGVHSIEVSDVDTVTNLNYFSGHSAAHLISPEGKRLPLSEAPKNLIERYFGNHLLVAGFTK